MLFSLRCIPLINHPTRFSQNTATLLDHVYTNNIVNKNTSRILTSNIFDHLPVLVLINNAKQRVQDEALNIRDTRNFDCESFLMDLEKAMSDQEYDQLTIRDQCSNFITAFSETVNQHAPLRKHTKKELRINKKPWITKGLLKSIKTKISYTTVV